jgi:aspartate 1-decarboxylase
MQRILLKSKLHRLTVTESDLDYEGSLEIDQELLEAADLWEGEQVLVVNRNNGARVWTYAQVAPPGSRRVCANGPAAHLIKVGDIVTVMVFAVSEERIKPRVLRFAPGNEIIG